MSDQKQDNPSVPGGGSEAFPQALGSAALLGLGVSSLQRRYRLNWINASKLKADLGEIEKMLHQPPAAPQLLAALESALAVGQIVGSSKETAKQAIAAARLPNAEGNTWPGGHRHAIHQSDHEAWNAINYFGTRQICVRCQEPTGRCEEDSIYADEEGPLCPECYRNGKR